MKTKVLKTITVIALVVLVLAACCVDSDSWIPSIVCLVCEAWLTLMLITIAKGGNDSGSGKTV